MLTATRVRLYPNATQVQALARQFGCARWAWNNALAETQRLYRETGKGLGYEAMCARLPKLKGEFPWLADAVAQALQQALRNLSRAFVNFFERKARYPALQEQARTPVGPVPAGREPRPEAAEAAEGRLDQGRPAPADRRRDQDGDGDARGVRPPLRFHPDRGRSRDAGAPPRTARCSAWTWG
jgi:hypothetical protein